MSQTANRVWHYFFLAVGASSLAIVVFCLSSFATKAELWTPVWHGVALLLYGTLLLQFSPIRIGWLKSVALVPIGLTAPCLVFVFTLFPILCFPPMSVLTCGLAMLWFIGSPLNIVYQSKWPLIVSTAGGFATPLLEFACGRVAPSLFTNVMYNPAQISLFASALHLTTMVAIVVGHADATVRQPRTPTSDCGHCGYDLTGVSAPICPECGAIAAHLVVAKCSKPGTPKA